LIEYFVVRDHQIHSTEIQLKAGRRLFVFVLSACTIFPSIVEKPKQMEALEVLSYWSVGGEPESGQTG
jgi:hypothetical protein